MGRPIFPTTELTCAAKINIYYLYHKEYVPLWSQGGSEREYLRFCANYSLYRRTMMIPKTRQTTP